MFKHALVGIAILATQVGGFAQTKPVSPSETELAAVDKTWAEYYQSCKPEEMSRLLADNMLFIHVGGSMQNKTQFVDSVRPCAMEQVTTEVTGVRFFNNGSMAILTGKMAYRVKNVPPGNIIYSRVYLKDAAGKWSLVSHQSTAAAAPRPAQ